jgi:hypothetical protein
MILTDEKWAFDLTREWENFALTNNFVVLYGPAEQHGVYEWKSVRETETDPLVRYVSLAVLVHGEAAGPCRAELRAAAEDARGSGSWPVAAVDLGEVDQLYGWLADYVYSAFLAARKIEIAELDRPQASGKSPLLAGRSKGVGLNDP